MGKRPAVDSFGKTKRYASELSRFYNVLGVSPQACDADIRTAYRRRALATHPDKQGGDPVTFRLVVEAFEAISSSLRQESIGQTQFSSQQHGEAISKKIFRNAKKERAVHLDQSQKPSFSASSVESPRSESRKVNATPQVSQEQQFSKRVPGGIRSVPVAGHVNISTADLHPAMSQTDDLLQADETSWAAKISLLTIHELDVLVQMTTKLIHADRVSTKRRDPSTDGKQVPRAVLDAEGGETCNSEDQEGSDRSTSTALEEEALLQLCDHIDVACNGTDGEAHYTPTNKQEETAATREESAAMMASTCSNVPVAERLESDVKHSSHGVKAAPKLQRGIHHSHAKGRSTFVVTASWQNFTIVTQGMHGLEEAIELHIFIVRVRELTQFSVKDGCDFPQAFQNSLERALHELGSSDNRESFMARLRFTFSLYHKGIKLRTPVVRQLSLALENRNCFLNLKAADAPVDEFGKARAEMILQKRAASGGRFRDHGDRNRKTRPKRFAGSADRTSIRPRRLLKIATTELRRRQSVLRRRLGMRAGKLPEFVDGIMDDTNGALLFARLEAKEGGAHICGPCQVSFESALNDVDRLQHVQSVAGDEAARREANQMDIEVAVCRFRDGLP